MNKKYITAGVVVLIAVLIALIIFLVMSRRQNLTEDGEGYSPPMSEEARNEIEESNRVNAPDVYLANKLPFENDVFRMTMKIDQQQGVYIFMIEPKSNSLFGVQESLFAYLQELRLTSNQIDSLNIVYVSPVD